MHIESFRNFCLKFNGVTEEMPFGEDILVYKVAGKMFSLTDMTLFTSINLKCDPDYALELREQYEAVQPGYHMNKKHWNTILMNGEISDKLIQTWIEDSYNLVVNSLTKKQKSQLSNTQNEA